MIEILDQTVTAMGSRQLRKWIVLPLKEKEVIDERLNMVDAFYQDTDLTEKIVEELRHMADLERLISKVAAGRINPRELLQLKKSLQRIAPVKKLLAAHKLASLPAVVLAQTYPPSMSTKRAAHAKPPAQLLAAGEAEKADLMLMRADADALLAQVARALRPGGLLFIRETDPARQGGAGLTRFVERAMVRLGWNVGPAVRYRPLDELAAALAALGFSVSLAELAATTHPGNVLLTCQRTL